MNVYNGNMKPRLYARVAQNKKMDTKRRSLAIAHIILSQWPMEHSKVLIPSNKFHESYFFDYNRAYMSRHRSETKHP